MRNWQLMVNCKQCNNWLVRTTRGYSTFRGEFESSSDFRGCCYYSITGGPKLDIEAKNRPQRLALAHGIMRWT